ncbi:hypothetical protein GCK32_010721 [Trichostrongylus colubriformis]|uniref:Uncharacterized protein n=1 Tax=Trichostrongylus colubriformis TaxID=6319 RepID=A0AAN8IIS6_TRICO
MASKVRAQKGLVTKRIAAINTWLQENEALLTPPAEEEKGETASRCRLALRICDDNIELLELSLNNFADTFEGLKDRNDEDDIEFDKYVDRAHDTIMLLHTRKTELLRILHESMAAEGGDQEFNRETKAVSLLAKAAMEKRLRHEVTYEESDSTQPQWTLREWLSTVEGIISQEEKLKEMMAEEVGKNAPQNKSFKAPSGRAENPNCCEFCKQRGHRWNSCLRLSTPSAKRNFLMESNRCLNCGSNAHRVSSCPGGTCRKCQGIHHTAICTKTTEHSQGKNQKQGALPLSSGRQPRPIERDTHKLKPPKTSKQHSVTVVSEPLLMSEQETIVLQTYKQPEVHKAGHNKVVLLVGSAQVFDGSGELREAIVLLDTGSELSFISDKLADELELPTVGNATLSISTFGSEKSVTKECEIVILQLCDIEGRRHELRLHCSPYITGTIQQADLDKEDLEFISRQGITLSLPGKLPVLQPQILLGCDYLWNFMKSMGKMTLPSGLQLIPTKLGYISLWKDEYGWDTPLSPALRDQWLVISCSISVFYKELERKTQPRDEKCTMAVFADASQIAMAACVYITSSSSTKLIMAKSKLPSLKTATTIPKLEMNALTLGARLAHFVHTSLGALMEIHQILFFTDSEIVLGWIQTPPDRQNVGVLVANRLKGSGELSQIWRRTGYNACSDMCQPRTTQQIVELGASTHRPVGSRSGGKVLDLSTEICL